MPKNHSQIIFAAFSDKPVASAVPEMMKFIGKSHSDKSNC